MAMTIPEIRKLLQHASEQEIAAIERSLAADTRKGVRAALEAAHRRLAAEKAECDRIESLYLFERSFLEDGQTTIVGLDEVGRGAVAGPLAVCAVVLPAEPRIQGLNDSKRLTPDARERVAKDVMSHARSWAVEYVSAGTIDREGMSSALRRAFSGALKQIEDQGVRADVVLVDGNPLHIDPRERNIVKGDAKCASIAAASIVAKVQRDALMKELSSEYPAYGFEDNKGYGSAQHVEAIRTYGLTDIHRKSFCKSFMQETLF